MAEKNKSYRIRTTVGRETDSFLDVHLDQDYESLEILSIKISDKDTYKLHNSDYGVIVGRVLANGNFGVPNAKISVFIPADEQNSNLEMWNLYPYTSTSTKNENDIRYNLLPDESVKDCHKAVGTFPHKTFLLENDALLEVFDKYYLYTTRTNNAGDYLICGVPTGMQTLHMDLDLSDCGILSQRPRDFVYKGYTIEQFDNPNQFKKDENLDSLAQIFSQDQPVYVQPFWGNEDNGETIGITRADIQISFKFEPTCVFMGSAISDNASNGVGKKCVPTNQMGAMDELTAGEGTIEMIRKTPGGHVEEFAIKGNQLINGNGVWCYQIPMNLDYMMTDEYGNMVPTDDPEKGIPTRARVRFRASLTDMDGSSQSYYRAKYLIPNNPAIEDQKVDYNFGTYTDESSYRDLFWNGVYTVKSYIPRFQKSKRWRSERFSGIKACNYYGGNNPMPYNNMRIRLPFMFTVLCIFVKLFIKIVSLINRIIAGIIRIVAGVIGALITLLLGPLNIVLGILRKRKKVVGDITSTMINPLIKRYAFHCTFIGDGLCPDMEGWYFAPGCGAGCAEPVQNLLLTNTLAAAQGSGDNLEDVEDESKDSMNSGEFTDETSVDVQNTSSSEEESVCVTRDVNYLVNCFEMNLAQEYRVIKFDFYNDWVNGVIYFPRWMRKVKRKKKYKFSLRNGIKTYYKDKVQGCMNAETSRVKKSRYYTQQCSLTYSGAPNTPWTGITTYKSCYGTYKTSKKKKKKNNDEDTHIYPSKCHKRQGMDQSSIFGKKSGLVTEETTMLGQYVYYLKPCEWKDTDNGRVRTLLFATDLILLGTLNDCDENGIPQAFKYLNNSSYIMPTNLALTTMDDDAYIYSNDGGTVCSSKKTNSATQTKLTMEEADKGVRRVTPNYDSTNKAYSETDGDMVDYGENDDPIPVTEAAGITWNYSGPGQDDVNLGKLEDSNSFIKRLFGGGNKRYAFLYYPGGHFLGLSCTNSDSNIKSCVNLKRICEVGATMSQRREEIRGYDDVKGLPKYRYYVPTGLISNVDIEGASFRAMFATLNHNKLVATETNDKTGYKKYGFRFLRPDGFDGSLANHVHQAGSPYNKKVNEGEILSGVTDSSNFFRRMFPTWEQPDDYDQNETTFTERRTVEDSIDDYYMFRFGLDTFQDKEQKKHYLKSYGSGKYALPQYENSFYFYFGLRDGSTALDEFKKQFYSECQSNNILRTPVLTVKEKIEETETDLLCRATLIIDNMVPTYTIKLKDNTTGWESEIYTSDNDSVLLNDLIPSGKMEIGHEYTVTVTDSIDQTVEKTFVFGASAVRVDIQSVHFRVPGDVITGVEKKGGYVKINDVVIILKKEFRISNNDVTFRFFEVVNGIVGSEVTTTNHSYTDGAGERWYNYFLPKVGTYDVCVYYHGKLISVYRAKLDDNKRINLFVSCDYLSYKPEVNRDGGTNPAVMGNGIGAFPQTSPTWWQNNTSFFQGNDPTSWLLRHTFYRQTENDKLSYDNYIYSKGNYEIAIFGRPEMGNSVVSASLKDGSPGNNIYRNDYNDFPGYFVDDAYSFFPTMYWDGANKKEEPAITLGRFPFDAMAFSEDGRAAANASNVTVTGYNYAGGLVTLTFNGSDIGLQGTDDGHGAIAVLENGTILFCIKNGSTLVAHSPNDIYPNGVSLEILAMTTVYPTMRVPTIYKPFHCLMSAATWNVQALSLTSNDTSETVPEKVVLPLSYKVEGDLYNGLTYNNKFYIDSDQSNGYETYMIFEDESYFYDNLGSPEIQTASNDHISKRKVTFGKDGKALVPGFFREVTAISEDYKDIDEISYSIKEGIPPSPAAPNVLTERYDGGYDQITLKDSCSLVDEFYDKIYVKIYDANLGLAGPCSIYTEELVRPQHTEFYRISKTTPLFIESDKPLYVKEGGTYFYYGTYNEKAKFDIKGTQATVTSNSDYGRFSFSFTQDNGAKITKKTPNDGVIGEAELYESGITLLHQYVLNRNRCNPTMKNPVDGGDKLNDILMSNNAIATTVSTKARDGSVFTGTDFESIVAVYTKPDDGTKNKMIVYRIYPIKALDPMFPATEGGILPYFSAPDSVTFTKEAQTGTITVSTNVKFEVASNDGWIHVSPTSYESTATAIQIELDAYTDTLCARTGSITVTVTEEGVEIDGYPDASRKNTFVISIIQTRDDVKEAMDAANAAQQAADDAADAAAAAQTAADTANQRIDDLEPDGGGD